MQVPRESPVGAGGVGLTLDLPSETGPDVLTANPGGVTEGGGQGPALTPPDTGLQEGVFSGVVTNLYFAYFIYKCKCVILS